MVCTGNISVVALLNTNRVFLGNNNKIDTPQMVHTEGYLCWMSRSQDVSRWRFTCAVSHSVYAQFHLINAITRLLLGLFKFQYIWNFHEFFVNGVALLLRWSGKKCASSLNISASTHHVPFSIFFLRKKVCTPEYSRAKYNENEVERKKQEKWRKKSYKTCEKNVRML